MRKSVPVDVMPATTFHAASMPCASSNSVVRTVALTQQLVLYIATHRANSKATKVKGSKSGAADANIRAASSEALARKVGQFTSRSHLHVSWYSSHSRPAQSCMSSCQRFYCSSGQGMLPTLSGGTYLHQCAVASTHKDGHVFADAFVRIQNFPALVVLTGVAPQDHHHSISTCSRAPVPPPKPPAAAAPAAAATAAASLCCQPLLRQP